ncbi:MAG: hypothetical protein WAO78_03445 [Roseovarius sp.]|jgi:hypothetical protein
MSSRVLLAILVTTLLGGPTFAEPERSRLLEHKDWTVDLVEGDDYAFCDAYTMAGNETWISIYVFEGSGDAALEIRNPSWSLTKREAKIAVDVDYSGWEGIADLEGEFVFLGGLKDEFIEEVAQGNALALKDSDGHNILTFSLRGSAAAMSKLGDCIAAFRKWESVSSDPFARSGAGEIGNRPEVFGE